MYFGSRPSSNSKKTKAFKMNKAMKKEGPNVIRGTKNLVGRAVRAGPEYEGGGGHTPPLPPPSDMPDIGLLTTYFYVIIQWETHRKI